MANKSKLNELVHKQNLDLPEYNALPQDDGFICKLKLGEEIFVSKTKHSRKKAAEDDAAGVAILHLTTRNNSASDKPSQPVPSTDSLIQQEQFTTSQPDTANLISRTTAIDNSNKDGNYNNKYENKKEIPLNMFYPAYQKTKDKPSEELQDFCSSRGWTEPIYHLKVKNKESTCGVFVNKVLYSFGETYSTDEEAKQEAAKQVLAIVSAKPADHSEDTTKGITIIIPPTKRSHPATAKLVEPPKNNPVASVEEITSSITKLAMSSGTDVKPVDEKHTNAKQAVADTKTVEDTKIVDDKNIDSKQNIGDKNTLQHLCQKKGLTAEYKTEYPPNEVGYISKVSVNGQTFCSEVHGSKKAAEAAAAKEAIKFLTSNFPELNKTTNSTMLKGPGICMFVFICVYVCVCVCVHIHVGIYMLHPD